MTERILATIGASPGRRLLGVGALVGLGVLLIWLALTTGAMPAAAVALLLVLGIAALAAAQVMWRATALEIILTEDELRDSAGTVLARIDEIEKVDRGMFAMKPSNGFTLLMKSPQARAWRPGLWWRMGKRVAIGGVTSGGKTRPVADILTHKVQERKQAGPN
ncbi:hypothetical protein KUH32_11030 [Thalassococcus sp. CAU 1522]|uniref:DUF2244 domain-containing protein n=1 Tax=Thalassococcus arenae TaxID=2851652 RepID=A0ABS6N8H3_9RHOB|nr:hypothetical protein [Thalassococcus arenae]MBV2360311.1 hypothetical protein [Thalassococcus arenae]